MSDDKKVGKKVGFIAGKLLSLTQKGAKKLEDYANKSAEENQNENARKLAAKMNKISTALEEKHDAYVNKVEENADELVQFGQRTFDKMKKVYSEMRTRAETAKEKAEADSSQKKEEKVEVAEKAEETPALITEEKAEEKTEAKSASKAPAKKTAAKAKEDKKEA